MSIKHEIADLRETIRALKQLVIRGALPDLPVLRQTDDGSDDVARFKRDYECLPAEALERGAHALVERVNFRNPDVPVTPREAYERFDEPGYASPLMQAPAAGSPDEPAVEAAPAPPEPAADPLVDSILRQARDNAKARDAREAARAR